MNFYEHVTIYKFTKPHLRLQGRDPSALDFYKDVSTSALMETQQDRSGDVVTLFNQSQSEYAWYKNNQVYYKIFPDWIPTFAQTKLDIPGEFFKCPFDAFVVAFPVGHNMLCSESGEELKSILVIDVPEQDMLDIPLSPDLPREDPGVLRKVTMWLDFGEVNEEDDMGLPVVMFQNIKFMEGDSVEEALLRQQLPEKQSPDISKGMIVDNEVIIAATKIVVSICFLATGADRLIQPDVLNKDMSKLLNNLGDDNMRKKLHGKARQRGKYGFTVGHELLYPARRHTESMTPTHPRGGLKFSHVRSGHFHTVRHGPGRSQATVKWFDQTVVREDLPPDPRKRGYKQPSKGT